MRNFNLHEERCPTCNAKGQCRIYASYDRNIVDYYDGKVIYDRLRITRVLCTCGHTHAILPDFIIPYKHYSLPFILHVLQVYFSHAMTLEKILEVYGISHKVLERWKAAYGKHKDLWLGMARSKQISAPDFLQQILALNPFSSFTFGFYRKTLFSFMQSHANPANCRHIPPGSLFCGLPCT